jgi:hypothetical protein
MLHCMRTCSRFTNRSAVSLQAYDAVAGTQGLTLSRYVTPAESCRQFPTLSKAHDGGKSLKGTVRGCARRHMLWRYVHLDTDYAIYASSVPPDICRLYTTTDSSMTRDSMSHWRALPPQPVRPLLTTPRQRSC